MSGHSTETQPRTHTHTHTNTNTPIRDREIKRRRKKERERETHTHTVAPGKRVQGTPGNRLAQTLCVCVSVSMFATGIRSHEAVANMEI